MFISLAFAYYSVYKWSVALWGYMYVCKHIAIYKYIRIKSSINSFYNVIKLYGGYFNRKINA